jgi:hypothetical protein
MPTHPPDRRPGKCLARLTGQMRFDRVLIVRFQKSKRSQQFKTLEHYLEVRHKTGECLCPLREKREQAFAERRPFIVESFKLFPRVLFGAFPCPEKQRFDCPDGLIVPRLNGR